MVSDHGIIPKDLTGIPGVDAHILPQDIDAAVACVRHLCGWHVWPVREDHLRLDARGDSVLFLPTLRVVELLGVSVNGREIPLQQFAYSEAGMIDWPHHRFPRGLGVVDVYLRHGFDNPTDLKTVVGLMASRSMQSGQSIQVGAVSLGGGTSVTPLAAEWRVLDLYKLRGLP